MTATTPAHVMVLPDDASVEVASHMLRAAWELGRNAAAQGRLRNPPYTDVELAFAWTVGWDAWGESGEA